MQQLEKAQELSNKITLLAIKIGQTLAEIKNSQGNPFGAGRLFIVLGPILADMACTLEEFTNIMESASHDTLKDMEATHYANLDEFLADFMGGTE